MPAGKKAKTKKLVILKKVPLSLNRKKIRL